MPRRTCFDCDYVDEREVKDRKVWCRYYKGYYYPDDADRCQRFAMTSGSSSGSICYLTTACCEVMGYPDDCFELEAMRSLRDNYIVNKVEDGQKIVEEYYDSAPKVIENINRKEDAESVWKKLYHEEILPCANLVKAGEYENAYKKYLSMTDALKKEYLS